MPTRRRGIVICGYYGWTNTGDEAILSALVGFLHDSFPDTAISVLSGDPESTARTLSVDAFAWNDPAALTAAIQSADLVIIGGGGLFHDYFPPVSDRLFTFQNGGIEMLATAAIYARLLNRRTAVFGAGIGPLFSKNARVLTRQICDDAALIDVRDKMSASALAALGIPEGRINVTADCAFAVPQNALYTRRVVELTHQLEGSSVIGISVRSWPFGIDQTFWQRQLSDALNLVLARTDAMLVFIPFQTLCGIGIEDDREVARHIRGLLNDPRRALVVEDALSPAEICALFGRCDAVLSMRYHAIALAAMASVPVIPIAYDTKVRAIAEQLEIGELLFDLRSIEPGEVVARLQSVLRRRAELAQHLRTRTAALRDIAQGALRNLAALIGQMSPGELSFRDVFLAATLRAQALRLSEIKRECESLQKQLDQLTFDNHKGFVGFRLRRGLHRLLDLIQGLIPEVARRAIRPVYLSMYSHFFPKGGKEFHPPSGES